MGRKNTVEIVERLDFQRIDAARVTETTQGFLRVSGNLTRVGVLPYHRADGSVFRELRLPEEVFREDSLATMQYAPVTDLHGGMVTPSNVGTLQVGIVGEDVSHGDTYVTGTAIIQRADAIADVRSKRRCELSPGYRCWIQQEPGEWNGQRYDGIQRDITYNHLAIGPKGWGRSGADVALRMDGLSEGAAFARMDSDELASFGAYLREHFDATDLTRDEIAHRLGMGLVELGMVFDGFSVPDATQIAAIGDLIEIDLDVLRGFVPSLALGASTPQPETKKVFDMSKLKISMDGALYEVEVAEGLVTHFETAFSALQTKADSADTISGELDAEKKARGDVQSKLDAATDPKAVQAAVTARAELVESVKALAPDLDTADKFDAKELKLAALVATGHDAATLEDKSDGYIEGLFAGAVASAPKASDEPATGTRSIAVAPVADKEDADDNMSARDRMIAHNHSMSR